MKPCQYFGLCPYYRQAKGGRNLYGKIVTNAKVFILGIFDYCDRLNIDLIKYL